MPKAERVDTSRLGEELAGLDALDLPAAHAAPRSRAARALSAVWPKAAAVALGLAGWQLVVWSGWKPEWVLPGPLPVLGELGRGLCSGELLSALATTGRRALTGFALATVIGVLVGSLVARVRLLRLAFGSLVTGLQTMPSIAWFPLAILLFHVSERAILFVVVLGAAPAVANGVIAGADNVPPLLLRAAAVLGAKGLRLHRHVVLPASLPSVVTGLKQGWAFAWRSLMAGELLVIVANRPSIGVQLQVARDFADARALLATMILILILGVVVDALVFGAVERAVRRGRGLLPSPS